MGRVRRLAVVAGFMGAWMGLTLFGCAEMPPAHIGEKAEAGEGRLEMIRREPVGDLVAYAAMRDPYAAAWFAELPQWERDCVVQHLNQYAFVLRDPLKRKSAATWGFAESAAPELAIESRDGADTRVTISIISAQVEPALSVDSDRRRCVLRLTWEQSVGDLYQAGVPLKPGAYECLLDFSYEASPKAADRAAARRSVAPEAGAALVVREEATLFGVLSLKSVADGRVRLTPASNFFLANETVSSDSPMELAPGGYVYPFCIDWIGAGGTQYTYLGEAHGVFRFLECSSFYDIVPTTYRYIDVRPYGAGERPAAAMQGGGGR